MAGRGQIPNPALRRYDDAHAGPAIYVMEAGDGIVKVGRALVARNRLRELHTYMVRHGFKPGRFQVIPVSDRELYAAEAACLRAMRQVASPIPGRAEYFLFDRRVAHAFHVACASLSTLLN